MEGSGLRREPWAQFAVGTQRLDEDEVGLAATPVLETATRHEAERFPFESPETADRAHERPDVGADTLLEDRQVPPFERRVEPVVAHSVVLDEDRVVVVVGDRGDGRSVIGDPVGRRERARRAGCPPRTRETCRTRRCPRLARGAEPPRSRAPSRWMRSAGPASACCTRRRCGRSRRRWVYRLKSSQGLGRELKCAHPRERSELGRKGRHAPAEASPQCEVAPF